MKRAVTVLSGIVLALILLGDATGAPAKNRVSQSHRDAGQIACTVAGCQRIPPGCHPETGYNWDGIPTGFDIVVCDTPRPGRLGRR
jgi:hypothetical protein